MRVRLAATLIEEDMDLARDGSHLECRELGVGDLLLEPYPHIHPVHHPHMRRCEHGKSHDH